MRASTAVLLLFFMTSCVPCAAAANYTTYDLGTLGGNSACAFGINDAGQVAGWSLTASGSQHAFIWSQTSHMRDLGTLGGSASFANDVNQSGQVVGWSETADGKKHAFLWDESTGMRDLGEGAAVAINNHGQVAINSYPGACVWSDATGRVDLLPDYPEAYQMTVADINDARQVAGSVAWQYGPYPYDFQPDAPFLWDAQGGLQLLGHYSPDPIYPVGVTESGTFLGNWVSLVVAPMLWSESTGYRRLTEVPVPWISTDISESGCVTGYIYDDWPGHADWVGRAFVLDPIGDVAILPSDYAWCSAQAVNESGWVVGSVTDADGWYPDDSYWFGGPGRAVLWVPVPEPSCLLALICGLACMVRRRR